MENCTELDLSYNRISEVNVGMFEGLGSLKRLLLMALYLIDTVEDRSFLPLCACTEVVLSENMNSRCATGNVGRAGVPVRTLEHA